MRGKLRRVNAIALVIALLFGLSSLAFAADTAETVDNTQVVDEPAEAPVESEAYTIIKGFGIFAEHKDSSPATEMTSDDFYLAMEKVTGYSVANIYPVANANRVTCAEAMRAFVGLLGYNVWAESDGGYPVGYLSQALKLKLFKDVSLNAGSPVTFNDFAQIVYNAFNVEVLQQRQAGDRMVYETIRGETFLAKIMGLTKLNGQVTANNVTGIQDENGDAVIEGLDKYGLHIDGNYFKVTDGTAYIQRMIGRYVEAYYWNGARSDTEENTMVYARISNKDDSITVNAEDIIGYSDGVFEYTLPGQTRGTEVTLDDEADVIYNGEVVTNYTKDLFQIEEGSVVIVSGPNGDNKVAIITDFIDFPVSGVDANNFTLYNKIPDDSSLTDDDSIVLNVMDSKNDILIKDTEGNVLTFGDIRYGDVLSVAKNNRSAEVYVCRDKLKEFTIRNIETDGEEIIFSSDEQSVVLSSYFIQSDDYEEYRVGDQVTILLNMFGKAAWISAGTATEEYYDGYLVKSMLSDGVGASMEMKIFRSDGEMIVANSAQKVTIDDANGIGENFDSRVKYTAQKAFEKIGTYSGVIRYRLDRDGNINLIELPLEKEDEARSSRLHKVTVRPNYSYNYKDNSKTFGNQLYLTADTIIYGLPEDPEDDDGYQIKTMNNAFSNDENYLTDPAYNMSVYSTDPSSVTLDVIAYTMDAASSRFSNNVAVVTDIVQAVAEDGTVLTRVIANRNGQTVIFDGDDSAVFDQAEDIPTCDINEDYRDKGQPKNTYKVQVGDVIRCSTVPKTGYVDGVQVLWRPTEVNPAYPQGQRGHLLGTIGSYSTDKTQRRNNPYGVERNSKLVADSSNFTSGRFRIMYGWVYSNNNNIITVTNQDLSCTAYDPYAEGVYTENYNLANFGNKTLINLDTKEITAEKGEVTDILPYEEAGTSCSRVLMLVSEGNAIQMFIINGSR